MEMEQTCGFSFASAGLQLLRSLTDSVLVTAPVCLRPVPHSEARGRRGWQRKLDLPSVLLDMTVSVIEVSYLLITNLTRLH